MNTNQYEFNEIKRFNGELAKIEQAPLNERKEDRQAMLESLVENPEQFLNCCDMLIAGNYGAGSFYSLKKLSQKHNRRAWIFCTVAALEYRVSNVFARGIWNQLSEDKQNAINSALDRALEDFDSEQSN